MSRQAQFDANWWRLPREIRNMILMYSAPPYGKCSTHFSIMCENCGKMDRMARCYSDTWSRAKGSPHYGYFGCGHAGNHICDDCYSHNHRWIYYCWFCMTAKIKSLDQC